MSIHDFIYLTLHQQAVKISNCIDNLLIEVYSTLKKNDKSPASIKNSEIKEDAYNPEAYYQKLSWYLEVFEKKAIQTKLSHQDCKKFFSKNTVITRENWKEIVQYLRSVQELVCERTGIKRLESDYVNLMIFDNATHENSKDDNNTCRLEGKNNKSYIVIIDNVRSPFNVGSIIRTSEAFDFDKVYLHGLSAAVDEKKVQRSAMNSEKFIDINRTGDMQTLIQTLLALKSKNYTIIGFEKTEKSIPITNFSCNENCVIVVGNEEFGIQQAILDLCDYSVFIPLYGIKNSLNVSNAFAIAAYSLTKRVI